MREFLDNIEAVPQGNLQPPASEDLKPRRSFLWLLLIVISNLLILYIALKNNLAITEIIWVYWCEGVLVGAFQFLGLLTLEYTSIPYLKEKRRHGIPLASAFASFFLLLQFPFHGFFAAWIYSIDPHFDYVYQLLEVGVVLLIQRAILYFIESRPWGPERPLWEVIRGSCFYFLRFLPVIAVYHYIMSADSGRPDQNRLLVEFMLCKLSADVIFYLIERKFSDLNAFPISFFRK